MKTRVEFKVLFAKDGSFYQYATYKTFRGARRYISNSMWGWRFDGWAIERYIYVDFDTTPKFHLMRLHAMSCVLAQSKNFPPWNNLKRENLVVVALPFDLNRKRFSAVASQREPSGAF